MTPARYQCLADIFAEVCELSEPQRMAHLDRACVGDPSLRIEVEALLAGDGASAFLTRTALELRADDGPTTALDSPEFIGRYRLVRLLGEGGMGAAYEAQQENPHRRVAIKTIRAALRTPRILQRFEYEAQILGRLRHPGIAQVYEAGVAETPYGKLPFIAMELVQGCLLDDFARRAPDRRQRLELFANICDAVQHAHQQGVIHRDLKPANILVEEGPGGALPKILDFGVARLVESDDRLATLRTEPGALIGTLPYMSPEQVSGDGPQIDTRTDVYSLGVILFELLTGQLPLDVKQRSVAEALRVIMEQEAPLARRHDPTLRGDLETICAKAMEKDRERRYQAASELAADVRRHLRDETISARPATAFYQLRKFARRNRGLVVGLAVAGIVLLLGTASTVWYAIAAGRERNLALAQQDAARWTSYRLLIAGAQDGVERDPVRANVQLAQAPEEHRNWEWRHLAARLETTAAIITGDREVRPSVAFAADDSPLAALVRAGRVEVVNVATGIAALSLDPLTGASGTAMSRDGRTLAVCSRESGLVQAYDIESGEMQFQRAFSGKKVVAIGLSNDGSLLGAYVEHDGVVVLHTPDGREHAKDAFDLTNAGYSIIEFSPDNRKLVTGASDAAWLRLVDLSDLASARSLDQGTSAVFDPRSRVIATGTTAGIRLRDAATLDFLDTFHGRFRNVLALSYSSDGSRLAAFVGSAVHVWNTRTAALERAVLAPDFAYGLAISPTNDRVLAVSPGRATLLSLTDEGGRVLAGHSSYVYLVTFSGDGKTIASAGWDGSVRVWDTATGRLRNVLDVQPVAPLAPVTGLAFSTDGKRLLALTHEGNLLEFDAASLDAGNGSKTERPNAIAKGNAAVESYWRDSRPGAKCVYSIGGERDCTGPRGELLAQVRDGVSVAVLDRATGKELLQVKAHEHEVLATAFSPDARHLVTACEDSRIRIWELSTGRMLSELTDHHGPVYTLSFNPDGSRMVSGDGDGLIFIWDACRFEKVAELRGHTSYVHSVAFSPNGTVLCSGSGDGTVRLWYGPAPKSR